MNPQGSLPEFIYAKPLWRSRLNPVWWICARFSKRWRKRSRVGGYSERWKWSADKQKCEWEEELHGLLDVSPWKLSWGNEYACVCCRDYLIKLEECLITSSAARSGEYLCTQTHWGNICKFQIKIYLRKYESKSDSDYHPGVRFLLSVLYGCCSCGVLWTSLI